jgi:hypothetical protein
MDKVPTVADLGVGEKEVPALGLQLPGAVVILDEGLGRWDSPDRAPTGKPRSFRISPVGANTRGSPQAGWRMSLPTFLIG